MPVSGKRRTDYHGVRNSYGMTRGRGRAGLIQNMLKSYYEFAYPFKKRRESFVSIMNSIFLLENGLFLTHSTMLFLRSKMKSVISLHTNSFGMLSDR